MHGQTFAFYVIEIATVCPKSGPSLYLVVSLCRKAQVNQPAPEGYNPQCGGARAQSPSGCRRADNSFLQMDLGEDGGARMRLQIYKERINQSLCLAIVLLAASEDLKEQGV